MAYKIKRQAKIVEELELDGLKTLEINIDIDLIAREYRTAYLNVIDAEARLREIKKHGVKDETVEEMYGNAIISLMNMLLGIENTTEILDYYDKNYAEMIIEIYPFLTEIIIPQVNNAVEERNKNIATKYKGKKR
jgi:hypothetical protein